MSASAVIFRQLRTHSQRAAQKAALKLFGEDKAFHQVMRPRHLQQNLQHALFALIPLTVLGIVLTYF